MKRNFWIAVLAVLMIIGAGAAGYYEWGLVSRMAAPVAQTPAPSPAPQATRQAPAVAQEAPSFDAVRIGPDGKAVIAGRAAPGADVTILDGDKPLGHATADANGEWVVIIDTPLPTGPQQLSLSAQLPGEQGAQHSVQTLALVVPERGAAQGPVAALLPQGQEAARPVGGRDSRAPRHLALDMVEYDTAGRTVLSGRADPGAAVMVAVNMHHVADAKADTEGEWKLTLGDEIPVGRYRLELTGRDADGGDAGDIALEMSRVPPSELGAGGALAVVPGNSLWHLARRSYGDGLRYVELYRANREKIDNPDRIYPGQVLALPDKS